MKKFITATLLFTILSTTSSFAASQTSCKLISRSGICLTNSCVSTNSCSKTNSCSNANSSAQKITRIITRCSPTYTITLPTQKITTQTEQSTTQAQQSTTQTTQTQPTPQAQQPTTPTQQTTPQTPQVSQNNSSYAKQVLDLVNNERAKNGLSPLVLDNALSSVAQAKSEDMMNKNYFSHTSPTYGSPFDMMKQFGISYTYAGENIAKGQKTPEQVVNAWMNSEGHRANILNKNFTKMGLGYAASGSTTYWTQMLIR
ncbi:MAG: hypothetical protein IJ736_02180 [Firmicutes bacterium]|nr:hypothetical protein [Bacillota bacterium]